MRKLAWTFVVILVAACSTRPLAEPSITGVITKISGDRIVIEENPRESVGSAKASVRIHEQTEIRFASGGSAERTELRTGGRVRVWFSGPVLESYPVQATAARIEILDH